uniref:thiosulfate sulfurtransferase GlpE n=1 Tax=Marinobacterium profundum TaxID=1714300 RepID=UPI00082FDEB0|nr:thiosulfate sulfurtransferase GlpE [Marinobacterium profundum]
MDEFKCISGHEALALIEQGAAIADIRDLDSFAQNHITNAVQLNNENFQDFIRDSDMDKPLIVCCYHGFSSQNAAAQLAHVGFDAVYSLNGGFEAWQAEHPDKCSR